MKLMNLNPKRLFLPTQRLLSTSSLRDSDVVIVSFARTPIGKLGGALSTMTAPRLASHTIVEAMQRSHLPDSYIEEAFFGNVVSAGIGQAPTRQAVIYAGLPLDIPSTTINKVCASGMKALMLASLSISAGYRHACLAGGMESMSNIPYYLPGARTGYRLGNSQVIDGLINDGLWDIYNNQHMGNCGEACAEAFSISREEQDQYAVMSYERATSAWLLGKMNDEVVPIEILGKKGAPPVHVIQDEEFSNIKLDKVTTLRPAFKKDGGTVTAANSSKINDGAATMVVVSGKLCKELNLKPLFKVRGFGDAARDPLEFTTAPADAIPRALRHAGLSLTDVDYHEINEAFAVVPLVNARYIQMYYKHRYPLTLILFSIILSPSMIRIFQTLESRYRQNKRFRRCNRFGPPYRMFRSSHNRHPIQCT